MSFHKGGVVPSLSKPPINAEKPNQLFNCGLPARPLPDPEASFLLEVLAHRVWPHRTGDAAVKPAPLLPPAS